MLKKKSKNVEVRKMSYRLAQNKDVEIVDLDLVRQYAVYGVMFRGVAAANGYSGHPALIKDPNVEQTKKAWFDAFCNEGGYRRYVSITPSSLSVLKNKQSKMTETSALVTVSVNELRQYLEKEGIIKGLSNLW